MRHLESSPVLITPETTQTTRDAAGKSQQVKEILWCWLLNTWTFNSAELLARVVIWKFKMAPFPLMARTVEKHVVDSLAALHIIRFIRA